MFSNFNRLDLTQGNLFCVSKPTMKHRRNWIGNWTFSDLEVVIGSACSLILSLNTKILSFVFHNITKHVDEGLFLKKEVAI
jgi:hypothetical protein